jgi:mxaJ protein
MSFSFPRLVALAVMLLLSRAALAHTTDLRVCADPDNMPFSNRKEAGFENKIAEVVARSLGAHLTYVWQRMGRGFVREYLNQSRCDLLIGIPVGYRPISATDPYYRSSYVFVVRRDSKDKPSSFNDPALHQMKIGLQVLEDDYTPPASALARRGIQNAIVGFDTTGAHADAIVDAVASRKIDTAIVWGPLAGYYARKYGSKLELTPVSPEVDPPGIPFTFAIGMGVRKGNLALRDEVERVLISKKLQIDTILRRYGVPQLNLASAQQGGS